MSKNKLVLQIMTMPSDCNPQGKIFGGFIMSKMDQAAGTICKTYDYVTKAATDIIFHAPVEVGDIVQCYAEILKSGKTSHTIKVDVHVDDEFHTKVCEGVYTMVRTDSRGRPVPHHV